jgi:hypothetical protein
MPKLVNIREMAFGRALVRDLFRKESNVWFYSNPIRQRAFEKGQ